MSQKVLICTPCHALHGGVERIIESLHDRLPAHGFEVVVGLAQGQRFHLPERYRGEYPHLRCVEIDGRSGTRLGRIRGLRRTLDQVRPDVVLVTRLFDAYQAVVERKQAGDPIRLAVTVQAYEADYIADLAAYADFVDLCVTSGQLLAQAVRRFTSLPAEAVQSIPGGVRRPERFVGLNPSRPLRLGYVGRLDRGQKRVLDLVETLCHLRTLQVPFQCHVVGSGPAEEALRQALAAKSLQTAVTWGGWKTPAELYRDVYPELDILLHFAAWEGITIAPREAMAHGVVPVVARFAGCVTEGQFQQESNALTFDVGDTRGAAECVQRLHQDRELLRRLSAAARTSQGGIYSEDGALAAWAEGLHAVLRRPGRVGKALPRFAWPANGRLEQWGLPPAWAETARRLLGRNAVHTDPGGEWPHCSGLADPVFLGQIAAFAADYEKGCRRESVALA